MAKRRVQQSSYAVAGFWYTAWINAEQPDLKKLISKEFTAEELKEFEELNNSWKSGKIVERGMYKEFVTTYKYHLPFGKTGITNCFYEQYNVCFTSDFFFYD